MRFSPGCGCCPAEFRCPFNYCPEGTDLPYHPVLTTNQAVGGLSADSYTLTPDSAEPSYSSDDMCLTGHPDGVTKLWVATIPSSDPRVTDGGTYDLQFSVLINRDPDVDPIVMSVSIVRGSPGGWSVGNTSGNGTLNSCDPADIVFNSFTSTSPGVGGLVINITE